jgi:3-(3-hydroxy-phenyl)propionate hydroxylase
VQPEVVASDGAHRLLDDLTGACWRLVTTTPTLLQALDAPARSCWQALGGRGVVLSSDNAPAPTQLPADCVHARACDTLLADWLQGLGAQAVLVRPDHYVYGAAVDTGELRSLLGDLAAALGRG